jgi:hypothetical protein
VKAHRLLRALALTVVAMLVAGCGAAVPSTLPLSATAAADTYRLDLIVDKAIWRAGDLITGTSTLTNTGSASTVVYGSGMGLVSFEFREAGGSRELGNVMTADCGGHDLPPGSPVTTRLYANGAASSEGADAWIGSANDPSGARLPAGTWDVIVRASFTEGACGGSRVLVAATARVTVLP